jgi:hypothetical protein
MKTAIELNKLIVETTMNIGKKFPELSKYIEEMPVTVPNENAPEINVSVLEDYQESLNSLLKKYTINHNTKK